jgi:hypothetical protein
MNSMKTSLLIALFPVFLLSAERVLAYYDPGTQRWINRDPIGESGGANLYAFGLNAAVGFVDAFGTDPACSGYTGIASGLSAEQQIEFSRNAAPAAAAVGLATAALLLTDGGALPALGGLWGRILGWLGLGGAVAGNLQSQRALQPMLAAINQAGQVILNPNLMLSHRAFAERALGITSTELPPGVWVGTVGTVNGQITALNSMTFSGNMSAASPQIQQAVQKAVQCVK